jgi:hypothetical protein
MAAAGFGLGCGCGRPGVPPAAAYPSRHCHPAVATQSFTRYVSDTVLQRQRCRPANMTPRTSSACTVKVPQRLGTSAMCSAQGVRSGLPSGLTQSLLTDFVGDTAGCCLAGTGLARPCCCR